MDVETRDYASRCGCCNGTIPAGEIRWNKSGICDGSINACDGTCGAIDEVLTTGQDLSTEDY